MNPVVFAQKRSCTAARIRKIRRIERADFCGFHVRHVAHLPAHVPRVPRGNWRKAGTTPQAPYVVGAGWCAMCQAVFRAPFGTGRAAGRAFVFSVPAQSADFADWMNLRKHAGLADQH